MYRFPIANVANPDMSIAQLAERTGLPAGTLRMWEARHGFPSPARLPGGHRRYSPAELASVLEVVRLRRQGLSLAAAIDRVRRQSRPAAASVFAALRQRRPEVAPTVLPKRAVLALTHAIEDEYCARAAGGVLIGCFQRERFYRRAERRWRELARTAEVAVALADFRRFSDEADRPIEVPIDRHHPMAREWVLVIDAPEARACLAAWEQPSQIELPDAQRRFEVLWSFDPAVVAAATDITGELLDSLAPGVAARLNRPADRHVVGTATDLQFGGSLAHRMVGYLGAMVDSGRHGPAADVRGSRG